MAISKPEKVPQARITSVDITSFNGGLDQRGEADILPNSFSSGRNVMVDEQGNATHRPGLKKLLPDTVGVSFEKFPALYKGVLYYITADDGKIKYLRRGDQHWTDAGGDNVVTTNNVGVAPTDAVKNTFVRVLDKILILNGEDELGYLDLSDMKVYHYDEVTNPSNAPTATPTGITNTGDFTIYYGITFNSTVGQTALGPILSYKVNKIRETWKADGTEYLTLDRNNAVPAGATSWNLYMATAPSGGTIKPTDLLPLAMGLDLAQVKFVDNGSLPLNLSSGTAPDTNSTKGPKAKFGIEAGGRPVLYGVTDDEWAVYIGGDGEHALDFSPSNGGFRLVMNEGTNYYPMSITGFRNGQGIPTITVLFSSTQGVSKQSIVEQQTVNYGDITFVVWGATEQNYGAAGVLSPYATVNYQGGLYFHSTDGFAKFDTQASLQNVLMNTRISDPIIEEVATIKNSHVPDIIGAAWGNRLYWTIPSRGFTYNDKIVVHDINNPDKAAWYTFDIQAQWIGVVSPDDEPAFVYISQGKSTYRLEKTYVAQDEGGDGITRAFPMEITTGLLGSNSAHNGYYAVVQAVFYLRQFIGKAILTVRYRDRSGNMRSKQREVTHGAYHKSNSGGWSDTGYLYNQVLPTNVLQWDDVSKITNAAAQGKADIRVRIPVNGVTNEMQASLYLDPDSSSVILRGISFEGQNLGIAPDIR